MFESSELSNRSDELRLTLACRRWAAAVAVSGIGIIWVFFVFGDRPIASGMTFPSVLQGCILLSVPYLAILIAVLLNADRSVGLISASLCPLALIIFPFLAFVSWFVTNRAGPMTLLAPATLVLCAPAGAAIRSLPSKPKFLIGVGTLAILLGFYFWHSMLIYLGQEVLYVPCPPATPCHVSFF